MFEDSDAVQRACRIGDLALLSAALSDSPTELNRLDGQMGWTPIYRAVICRHGAVVRYLLDRGADTNIPTKVGEYPLHQAAETGQIEVAGMLLEKGADVDVLQNCMVHVDGETALHVSSTKGFTEFVQLLLKFKANLSIRDGVYGRTPLHSAVLGGSVPTVETLLRAGASLSVLDSVPLQLEREEA